MRHLNLMVDIDEVIFPMLDSIHALALEFGVREEHHQPTWRGWESYGCTEEAYWDLWTTFNVREGYTATPPIPGQVEALRSLAFDGHSIHLVTARGFMSFAERIRADTHTWVEDFAVPHKTLTFARDKAGAQEVLGRFDLAIDDSPSNYQRLDAAGVEVWLQDHPHNRHFDAERRVTDLAQWAEIVRQKASS